IDVSKEGAILKRSPNRKPSDINASVSDESSTIKGRLQSEHRNLETCGVKPFRVVWATTRYDPIIWSLFYLVRWTTNKKALRAANLETAKASLRPIPTQRSEARCVTN